MVTKSPRRSGSFSIIPIMRVFLITRHSMWRQGICISQNKLVKDSCHPRLSALTLSRKMPRLISVNSAGGAHGCTKMLYSFSDGRIYEAGRIFSDAPSIEEKDLDKDGIKEIISKMRNYDKNQTEDYFEEIYKWNGERFVKANAGGKRPLL